jgi:hypothetical protein
MGWASRFSRKRLREEMKTFNVSITVKLTEAEKIFARDAGGIGLQQVGQKVLSEQVTATVGEGATPKEATEEALQNGMAAYLEGLAEASDKFRLLAPAKSEDH